MSGADASWELISLQMRPHFHPLIVQISDQKILISGGAPPCWVKHKRDYYDAYLFDTETKSLEREVGKMKIKGKRYCRH